MAELDTEWTYTALDDSAARLRGKLLKLTAAPTSSAGDPQTTLIGHTDVIAISDSPDAQRNLYVHPLGQPNTIALVAIDKLALYHRQEPPHLTVSTDPPQPRSG